MSDDRLRKYYADQLKQEYLKSGFKQGFEAGYAKAKEYFERPRVEWGEWIISEVRCPECLEYFDTDCYAKGELDKCPSCGASMVKEEGDAE